MGKASICGAAVIALAATHGLAHAAYVCAPDRNDCSVEMSAFIGVSRAVIDRKTPDGGANHNFRREIVFRKETASGPVLILCGEFFPIDPSGSDDNRPTGPVQQFIVVGSQLGYLGSKEELGLAVAVHCQ